MKIKGVKLNYFWIALSFLFLTSFVFCQNVLAYEERIYKFDSKIIIQKDGSVLVTEKIVYDFGLNQKHGILRNIPLKSDNGPHY